VHALDCPVVDDCLAQGNSRRDGSVFRISNRAWPSVEAIVCCMDGAVGSQSKLFQKVTEVGAATDAKHCLILRYHSMLPRLISFDGEAMNHQLFFVSERTNLSSPDFGKECCSDKLDGHTCAEIMVAIEVKSTGQPELIRGHINAKWNDGSGKWTPDAQIDYELRLAAT
jgi:hypothetical protein